MSPELQLAALGLLVIAFILMTEMGARISYRRNFGSSYRVKRRISYPADKYIENTSPPLFYRIIPGFQSPLVNINRFGLRGPEPAADGVKKRFLFIGESPVFGSNLESEDKIWSRELMKMLQKNGHSDWEVINGGLPMYNSIQHRAYWSEMLDAVNPSAILISLGATDIAQAWVYGEDWVPGEPWLESEVRTPEIRQSRTDWILQHSCLYHFYSMIMTRPAGYVSSASEIDWEKCRDEIFDSYRFLHRLAGEKGIPVHITSPVPVYFLDEEMPEDPRLAGLQLDYRRRLETEAVSMTALYHDLKETLCPELELPFMDLYAAMQGNSSRLKCYNDLMHWNAKGMNFIAAVLYQEGERLQLWK